MSDEKKRGPVNHVEEIKKRKDGLDVLNDILRYSKEGFDAIDPDDADLFKWYGLYQQRPKDGYFMMRVRVPGGILTSKQLRKLGEIANTYGRGLADLTTRQTLQFHWLTIENVPAIFDELASVDMSTVGACGDIPRNVVGCGTAGLDKDEIIDPRPYIKAVNEALFNNRELSNLPRKFKISISGCNRGLTQPEINCVGFVGALKDGEAGFDLRVGGGLSTQPYIAQRLEVFVPADKVVDVAVRIAELFRDCGYRERRSHARLKYLVADWGVEKFRKELEDRLGYALPDAAPDFSEPRDMRIDQIGVHPQKQEGLSYLAVSVVVGRTNGGQLIGVAELAKKYADSEIRLTTGQNFLIPNIPNGNLEALQAGLEEIGFNTNPSELQKGAVTCTGIQFCNLAIAETKDYTAQLIRDLEQEVPLDEPLRIHVNGCPNSCGQHHIAEIGLVGGQTKVGNERVEAFSICLGGGLGGEATFADPVLRRIPSGEVKDHLVRILKAYKEQRQDGENFRWFCKRHTREQLAAMLQGDEVPAAVEA